ncbi:hypothetical protein [Glutamicibacter ardleyensis]|uniref:hypothetical protein n=1 Tax=Glutamicibacter ardleyensis TaxID=225894 RepID=UPI003FCEFEB0
MTALTLQNSPQIQLWVDNLPAIIAVTGTILGALIATYTTIRVTRMNNKHQASRAEQETSERKETWLREQKTVIYAEYLTTARLFILELNDIQFKKKFTYNEAEAMLAKMLDSRFFLMSSEKVVQGFRDSTAHATRLYTARVGREPIGEIVDSTTFDKSLRKLEALMREDMGIEPLTEFHGSAVKQSTK